MDEITAAGCYRQKKEMQPRDYLAQTKAVIKLGQRLSELLQADNRTSRRKLQALTTPLRKNKDSIVNFVQHPKVPQIIMGGNGLSQT